MLVKGSEGVRHLIEKTLAPEVADDGEVASDAGVDAHDHGEVQDQARWQVVDAVVAHVLEDMHGLRAPTSRHSRDDYDVRNAVAGR